MGSKICKIRQWAKNLAALERLEKSPYTYQGRNDVTGHSSALIYGWIFFILADNMDNHKSLDEFEFRQDFITDYTKSAALECLKN